MDFLVTNEKKVKIFYYDKWGKVACHHMSFPPKVTQGITLVSWSYARNSFYNEKIEAKWLSTTFHSPKSDTRNNPCVMKLLSNFPSWLAPIFGTFPPYNHMLRL